MSTQQSLLRHLVKVRWFDHISDDGSWQSKDDARKFKPHKFTSYGVVIKDAVDHIVIASTVNGDDYGGVFCIHKGTIENIDVLGKHKK